ncbi:MAG: sugar ABC transporter permease [Trueperaceae bacterium]
MKPQSVGLRHGGAHPDPETPYRRPGFWQRLRSGNPSEGQLAVLLLLPALITLAVVMLYPVLNVLWQSLHFERLNQPQRGTPFIGLDNFVRMLWGRDEMAWSLSKLWLPRALLLASLVPIWIAARRGGLKRGLAVVATVVLVAAAGWLLGYHPAEGTRWGDPRFWNSFNITLLLIVVTVVGAFLLGLPLALLANVKHPLKWLVRLALLLPWAMPRVFSGLAFAWLFQSDYGVVNDLLGRMGINHVLALVLPEQWIGPRGVYWLARDVPAVVAVSLAIIWKTSSFVGLILLAGLQSIDDSLYEAARIDGANAWQRFWRITLPLLRPAIMVALIFRTLTAVQTFDEPFAMTGGGPGRTLETLGIYIYKTVNGLDIGYAAALAVALFAISLFITIFYLRWIYKDD